MAKAAHLVLEDGSVYRGEAFGAESSVCGEVVFNTSMTGYQEILTDPSYAGQIVVLTYPLVGNYGVNAHDFESSRIQVAGLVVKECCDFPSHVLSTATLHEFLSSQGIPGIKGVDTRSITRRLRTRGVMMGSFYPEQQTGNLGVRDSHQPEPGLSERPLGADHFCGPRPQQHAASLASGSTAEAALAQLMEMPRYGNVDYVKSVTTPIPYSWDAPRDVPVSKHRIVVVDFGLKYNILRLLCNRGCEIVVVPAATSTDELLALKPSGVVLSPGPGDPALLGYIVDNVRSLVGRLPIMGICLGHQIVARALGADTFKLKYGHRGANHPVKDLATGKVQITAQNHGYAVDGGSLPPGLKVTHMNLNDGTVEGLRHREWPILTIQYHSEASPGPRDSEYLFDRFLEMVETFDPQVGAVAK